jgi:hypothetical protein
MTAAAHIFNRPRARPQRTEPPPAGMAAPIRSPLLLRDEGAG